MRTLKVVLSPRSISTDSSGMNFGSVVMMVLPAEDCGSSSTARRYSASSWIFGSTSASMKRLMNVDFPVRTGPTTPI